MIVDRASRQDSWAGSETGLVMEKGACLPGSGVFPEQGAAVVDDEWCNGDTLQAPSTALSRFK